MTTYYSDLNNLSIDATVFVIASSEQEAKELMLKEIEAQGYEAEANRIELSVFNPSEGALFLPNN